jgi:putative nucleotidyltransferase with HDIG domain
MFDAIEMPKCLLLVDENPKTTNLLKNLLKANHKCDESDSIEGATQKMRKKDYAAVLCSIDLPDANGLQLIERARMISPHTLLIFLSEDNSAKAAIEAFRAGAFDYLQKPLDFEQIEIAVSRAVEHYELKCQNDHYQFHLEQLIAERAFETEHSSKQIEDTYRTTLKALVQALEMRDFETRGHSERVVTFSLRLGLELGLNKEALRNLELGALLHDIGKIGVPDAVLRKPAKLTEAEWEKMKLHTIYGLKILRNIPFLEGASQIVVQHHERWDGEGYPHKIRGEEIDIGARIFAVADAFDAMISDRIYRSGRSYKEALEELKKHAGTQFDPEIVEAFSRVPEEDWENLRKRSLTEKQEINSFQSIVSELVNSQRYFEMVH